MSNSAGSSIGSCAVMPSPARTPVKKIAGGGNARFQRMTNITNNSGIGSGSGYNSAGGAGAADIAARFSEGCWVSDDENSRRTPVKRSPSSNRSFSFSVGTTPRAQHPSRMSISPCTSVGNSTPRRLLTTPTRTPSTNSGRRKGKIPVDPMSVCKSSIKGQGAACTSSGKENTSAFNSSQKENASDHAADSPARRRFHLPTSSPKNVRQYGEPDVRAFHLMPPPMPRTPVGKGGNGGGLRSTPVSPLQKHDPNHRGRGDAAASGGDAGVLGGGVGIGRGRSENRASSVKPQGPSSPTASPRSGTFSLGSGNRGRGRFDSNSPRQQHHQNQHHARTSSRGATAAAARCAPTPPRRSRSASASSGSRGKQHREREPGVDAVPGCGPSSVHPAPSGGIPSDGLKELLAGRASEFYEQGRAQALIGIPWEAARSFTRALKIVPEGWPGTMELLMARARVLSALGKHEACAKDCRVALGSEPSLLQGVTLMGHACLRLGLHDQATRFLHEGLALAISQADPTVMVEAQAVCRSAIEEASVVAAALESGGRAASHGQHEVALAAAVRVMGVAPHCIVAQEMRASALLGLLRPMECAAFCQAGCVLPRSDPEDDSDWPLDTAQLSPVQASLSMAPGVARLYAASLRGCGRECDAMPVVQALRCRDPSLAWCPQDIARWELARKLMDEGQQLSSAGDYDSAVRVFTQVLEGDVASVVPNAEAFCLRGSSRLGQGNALEALDDCYRALSLLSLEGGDVPGGSCASARGMALLVRGRAYLALSRVAESISDLKGCLKCNPGLTEASEYLRQAEQRQADASVQRRQRERQEREKEARVAAAAAATAEADKRAKEQAKKEREAAAAAAAAAAAEEKSRAGESGRRFNDSGYSTSNRPSGRRGTASPFRRPEPLGTRYGGGNTCGGAAAGADGMKTPAKSSGFARSPKIDSVSYYRRLGLRKDASEADIKKAYRKLALKYHPDKNKSDDAARSFLLVSEAYRILTSPDSKQQYDRTRRYSIETPPSNGGRGGGAGGSDRKNGRGTGLSSPWSSSFDNVRGYGYGGSTSGGRTRRQYDW